MITRKQLKAGAQQTSQRGEVPNLDFSNINFSDLNSTQKEEGELRDEEGSQQEYEITLENQDQTFQRKIVEEGEQEDHDMGINSNCQQEQFQHQYQTSLMDNNPMNNTSLDESLMYSRGPSSMGRGIMQQLSGFTMANNLENSSYQQPEQPPQQHQLLDQSNIRDDSGSPKSQQQFTVTISKHVTTTIRNESDDEHYTVMQPVQQSNQSNQMNRFTFKPPSGIQEEFKNEKKRDRQQFSSSLQRNEWLDADHEEDQAYARFGGAAALDSSSDQLQYKQKVVVTRSQLSGVMKSKLDIYNILTKEGQIYLPPYNECTMQFVKDIFTGKKKALKNSQIKMIDVPFFPELSAKNIMLDVAQQPLFTQYLPDFDSMKRTLNRQYLFNIVNTLDPDYFIENIRSGYELRKIRHCDRNEQKMEMDQSLYNLLMGSNQIVHNRGRALAYLGNAEKKRGRNEFAATGNVNVDSDGEQARHRYALKQKLKPKDPLNTATSAFVSRAPPTTKNPFIRPLDISSSSSMNTYNRKGDEARVAYAGSLGISSKSASNFGNKFL